MKARTNQNTLKVTLLTIIIQSMKLIYCHLLNHSSTEKLRPSYDQTPEIEIFTVLLRPVEHILLIPVTCLCYDTQIDRTLIASGLGMM